MDSVVIQADSRRYFGWSWCWEWRRRWCTTSFSWRGNISTTRSTSNWTSIISSSWRSLQSPSVIWVLSKTRRGWPLKTQRWSAEESELQVLIYFVARLRAALSHKHVILFWTIISTRTAITFDTLITQATGHRNLVSFSHLTRLYACSLYSDGVQIRVSSIDESINQKHNIYRRMSPANQKRTAAEAIAIGQATVRF